MSELYLVQAEYMLDNYAYSFVAPIAITDDYEYAKTLCEDTVKEDLEEGTLPREGVWNEYHDEYVYDDDEGTHICVYVCAVDLKNKG